MLVMEMQDLWHNLKSLLLRGRKTTAVKVEVGGIYQVQAMLLTYINRFVI